MKISNIMEMGATKRHGRLLSFLENSVFDLFLKEKVEHFSESASLAYWGKKKNPHSCNLINIEEISDTENFIKNTINLLSWVTPDYMHFSTNKFIINDNETRIAGFPNLIVEVWSKSNSDEDKEFLKYLYATSDETEHWYIEQDSNIVECWYGDKRIEDKSLKDILKTKDGIEFDLRYLALEK
jgi:hypothetical protein